MAAAKVYPFLHADTGTWTYLVVDPASDAAAIIDPVLDFDVRSGRTGTESARRLVDRIAELELRPQWILETHAHADHLTAAAWLKRQYPEARIGIGGGIREVQETFRPVFHLGPDFPVDGSQFDRLFADREHFAIGGLEVEVIAVPGHTSDSVAYHVGDAVFAGDSLFMPDSGTARCDFPGGDAGRLHDSIQKLLSLAPSTRVFVGHDYAPAGRPHQCESTVAEQAASNSHVGGGRSREDYVRMRRERDATLPVPQLLLPALQVNIRAGALPEPEANGVRYLKLPIDLI